MTWIVKSAGPLAGEVDVPGDKSMTHRAYILGAMGRGDTVVMRPLRAEDTRNTLRAIEDLGVPVHDMVDRVIVVGQGPDALVEPSDVLDLGNSGTGVRLLAGLLAGRPFESVLSGDRSLRKRPMGRIVDPLRRMGAEIFGRNGGNLLPLTIRGGGLKGIAFSGDIASAQVKSGIILAGLQASGETVYSEPALSRDHTELMLESMGVTLLRKGKTVTVTGGLVPSGCELEIPGDISSAAFFMVAAAAIEGSCVVLRKVGTNPTRTGILNLLNAMGADVEVMPVSSGTGEPVSDIRVRGTGNMRGICVREEWIPSIIDELPLAAVAAAASVGTTEVRGAAELRVKESDRISATVGMLRSAGAQVDEMEDGFVITGGKPIRGARYESGGDHRIAMCSAILGMMADSPGVVEDTGCVSTSFPSFPEMMNILARGSITTIE